MKRFLQIGLLVTVCCGFSGCESSGYSSYSTHVSYYSSPGWYDPYYHNRCCYTVVRPPVHRPGRPVTLPARPRPPRPSTRPMPRRR